MSNLRVICIFFIIYSLITMFMLSENVIKEHKIYLFLKHDIIMVLSIVLFGLSFHNKFTFINSEIVQYVFTDIIFIDLVYHMYFGYKHIKNVSLKSPEIYNILSVWMLIPILFATSKVTIACIGLSMIYFVISTVIYSLRIIDSSLTGVLLRVFASVVCFALLLLSIFISTFGFTRKILFFYRTIQIIHIVISGWTILNMIADEDAAPDMYIQYHNFNLLYGILKFIVSFI